MALGDEMVGGDDNNDWDFEVLPSIEKLLVRLDTLNKALHS